MIDSETRAILSRPALLAAREEHFDRLRRLYDGERLGRSCFLWGVRGQSDVDPYSEPVNWVATALVDLARKADALLDREVFRPLVIEFGPYGVHFVDKLFGADVYELDTKENWQARYLPTPIGELEPCRLEQSDAWRVARRLAEAFVATGVSVPLFGLPTIASALNIAVNLYGQRILLAMMTEPERARRDLRTINNTLCALHEWYLNILPVNQLQPVVADMRTQPPGSGQLCGCSTQLLSPELYREFIAPLDNELLAVYPNGGMIHLCGAHTQHLPVWREMRRLRAVQLNDRASEDFEIYFHELREDQVIYLNPTATMTAERAFAISKGRRVVFVTDQPFAR